MLVICHGNICRSPFAAALLGARLPALELRSAGLHAGDGNPADPVAARCAERLGVSLVEHRSRRVDDELLAWSQLILAMQGSHLAELDRFGRGVRRRARLLGAFLPEPPHLLEDPWGHPEPVFDAVFARIREAVEVLALRIEAASVAAPARRAG